MAGQPNPTTIPSTEMNSGTMLPTATPPVSAPPTTTPPISMPSIADPQPSASPVPVQTPPPAAPVTSGEPAGGDALSFDEVINWTDANGGQQKATVESLLSAHEKLSGSNSADFNLYLKAQQGDRDAAQQFLTKIKSLAGSPVLTPTIDVKPPIPTEQAASSGTPSPATPEGWNEMVDYINQQRQNDIRNGIKSTISSTPEFGALRVRPTAVEDVINRLSALHQNGIQMNAQIVNQVLKEMNEVEKSYQEGLQSKYRSEADSGGLGVDNPFLGGDAKAYEDSKPNVTDWEKYRPWLDTKLRFAIQSDKVASEATMAG